MKARLRHEEGSALVTAILVTFLVLTVGLTTAATVDTQQKQSRKQRERESTFQLSEAVLNTQVFQLSQRWPGPSDSPYPSCDATTNVADCPRPASVTSGYTGADYARVSWSTSVRDNGGALSTYYDEAQAATQEQRDANGDQMVWVRAESRLVDPVNPGRFKRRVLVALVRTESNTLRGLPVATLVVDHFETTNSGNKVIIDGNGLNNEFLNGEIAVRCEASGFGTTGSCANYPRTEQLEPNKVTFRPNPPLSTLSADQLDLLRIRARQEGNYYATGCAPSLAGDRAGEVVFMESTGSTCSYLGNDKYNAVGQPGVVIVGSGSIYLAGTSAFYGLIYHANLSNSSDFLVELNGDTTVFGSIQVAGRGGVRAGSSKENLVFDPRSIENIKTYGTAGIVQNSFRELRVAN
ncbi:MAG: hypothetical protein H0U80_03730 [Solirubrobacterales bacterium]|nr:hypothetical protein [Solirubrobacterales bacterium]